MGSSGYANEQANFNMDSIATFDPNQGIFNESQTDMAKRGAWDMPEGGERVNFSIIMKNKSASTINLELFNAERSVLKVTNGDLYSKNLTLQQYKPHSQIRTLYEIASLDVFAADSLPFSADPSAFYNEAGDAIFTSDRSYANLKATIDNIFNNGVDTAGTPGVDIPDAFIQCEELPYASLLDDISQGLVLDINQMRIQASVISVFQNGINLIRWQSFGGSQTNPLPFSIGRDPKNNLTDTIDIMKSFLVDKKTGIYFKLPAGCQLSITFFAIAYRANGIKW
jgi:hypothetical protein